MKKLSALILITLSALIITACTPEKPENTHSIRVYVPQQDEVIESPLMILGDAKGEWYFEGSFPFSLQDMEGKELATGFVTATGDWMTEDYVPFKGVLEFDPGEASEGKLEFMKDNPSGLPENDENFFVYVKF